jgi:pimeloyl-ACP methyl ester carboxylesterase
MQPLYSAEGWEMLASSTGPGVNQCGGSSDQRYPYAVELRAKANNGGFSEKIRYYREDLFGSTWSKSLQTVWELSRLGEQAAAIHSTHSPVSSVSSSTLDSPPRRRSSVGGVFDNGPPGTLGSATTIVWGAKDHAVGQALALEGIRDYFGVRPSQLVMLPKTGHWTQLEENGRKVFERVVVWAAEGEAKELGEVVGDGGKIVLEL